MLKEAAVTSTTRPADEAAIHEIIRHFEAAWNAGDGPASAEPFAPDVDYVVWNGMHVKGRQALAEGHQRIFDTFYQGSLLKVEIKSIRFLRGDVAVVRTESVLKVPQENSFSETQATQALVMTCSNGAWQVDLFQNTLIQLHENNVALKG